MPLHSFKLNYSVPGILEKILSQWMGLWGRLADRYHEIKLVVILASGVFSEEGACLGLGLGLLQHTHCPHRYWHPLANRHMTGTGMV